MKPCNKRQTARRGADSLAVAAVVLCCMLAAFLLSVIGKFILRRVMPEPSIPVTGENVHEVAIDWAARYPLYDAEAEGVAKAQPAQTGSEPNVLTRYAKAVRAAEAAVEAYATDDILLHDPMVELANAYDRTLGWEIRGVGEYNGLVTLGEGYFGTRFPRTDMTGVADDIAAFSRFCRTQELALLYVQLPFKIGESDAGVSGVVDFTNQNVDELLASLGAAGVDTFDLRAPLAARQTEAGASWHAAFFQTDHHWLPQTGLWAAQAVAERLNRDAGLELDSSLLDASRFTAVDYADFFLGSQGKKATLAVAQPETFALLYPKDEAELTLCVPSLSIETTGSFDVLYNDAMLGSRDYYNDNPYVAYFYGDAALKRVENRRAPNGVRLLVVQDSFSNVLAPFLALTVAQLDTLDLRYFTGSVETFIRQGGYDAVVVAYSADLLGYDDAPNTSATCWHNFK